MGEGAGQWVRALDARTELWLVRKIFERCGAALGASNCVAWMFSQKGVFVIEAADVSEERVMEVALENGADDVSSSARIHEVICAPEAFDTLKTALDAAGIAVQSSDITFMPATNVTVDLEGAKKVMRLIEALEDQDDVESVASNFDIPDDVLAQLSE